MGANEAPVPHLPAEKAKDRSSLSQVFWTWLFRVPETERPRGLRDILLWWEERRPAYNLLVAVAGIVSLTVFFIAIYASNVLKPGEDAEEPIVLLALPILVNIAYTLGWIVDGALWIVGLRKKTISSLLLKIGVGFSLIVIFLPSAGWTLYCLMTLCGWKPKS